MIGKLKVLTVMLMTIAFLLSLWLVPIGLAVVAFTSIETTWIQVALCVLAVAWLLLVRPWTIFSDKNFPRFISEVRRAITMIFN